MNFARRLLGLSPVAAFILINAGFAVGGIVWVLGTARPAPNAVFAASSVVSMIVFLGWPTIAAHYLSTTSGVGNETLSRPIVPVFIGALIAHGALVQLLWANAGSGLLWTAFAALTWVLGFAGPLYLLGLASYLLVRAEENRYVAPDRWIGTFLLFLVLPIGVVLVQRRLRRLVSN